ncbi:unnamed protein product [marine sediment metagenome]|uniref:Uncharacterized protein n=1 Tax=marine sediment metagenome TaxID=412755 RepID=X1GH31_9ZZZZ
MDATEGIRKVIAERKKLTDEKVKLVKDAVKESQESRHRQTAEQYRPE